MAQRRVSVGQPDVGQRIVRVFIDGLSKELDAFAYAFAAALVPVIIKHKIQDINVCGHEAAVDWKLHLTTATGKKIVIDGMGIFNFNQNGKLQSVREFWDLATFLAQLQG